MQVLRFANKRGIVVVPFEQGTSLEGHTISRQGGISVNTRLMGEILDVSPEEFVAGVEPGVTQGKLNASLEEHGLFFPVDPGWDASIAGMDATNVRGGDRL